MSQQMENIRWMAENDRYDAALEQALRLEYNSEKLTLLTRALPGYTGNPLAKAHVEKAIREAVPVEVGYTAGTDPNASGETTTILKSTS